MNRLKEKYLNQIVPVFAKELGVKNHLAVPKITKITLNMGIKDGAGDKGVVKKIQEYFTLIAGQKAIITTARKAEAAFKIRQGDQIGVKATLRGERMYEFLDKLISLVLPQVRDFQGVGRQSFDGQGNYSLGFTEQTIFPEVDYDKIDTVRGLQITINTNARNNQKALRLLELLGMPFSKL